MEVFKVGGFTLEVVDKPGKTLSPQQRSLLVQESIPVARRGFQNDGVSESDIIIHAVDVSTGVYLRDVEGRLIGFAGSVQETVADRTVIHLKGAALLPEYQGTGVYSLLIGPRVLRESEKIRSSDPLVGTRTQSPVVYHGIGERLGLYPKIGEAIPDDMKVIGKAYAQVVREKHSDFQSRDFVFDENSFVVRRAYGLVNDSGVEQGFSMYKKTPWLKDNPRVNSFFQKNLDLQNGDVVILLGALSRPAALAMLGRSVARITATDIVERFREPRV